MEVKYSNHLRFKMQVREIPEQMPERIYRESQQRYFNHLSLRRIAVMEVHHKQRRTRMMIAYDQTPDHVEIVTIHPISKDQIQEHLRTGRWSYEQTGSELRSHP